MKINAQSFGALTVLRPEGPLAGKDAEQFRQQLLRTQRESLGRFAVDASGIPLVDSKGLEALVDVAEEMGQAGRTLKLCGVNETVRQVLELTGLSSRFEHFEDANAAMRSFM